MLEFVDYDLYFVQDENDLINPLLQVGSGSVENSTGSGGPKITWSDRIRILIPDIIHTDMQLYYGGKVEIFDLDSLYLIIC